MHIPKLLIKYFFFLSFVFFSPQLYSQVESAESKLKKKESILYFDEDWNIVSSKYNAEYYRIFKIGINNSSEGKIKDYFKSGKIQNVVEKAIYIDLEDNENWKFDGLSKIYYETGELESKFIYVDGKIEGFYKKYYKSGKLKFIKEYKNGLLNGNISFYRESGKLELIEEFKNGLLNGNISFYNESGKLESIEEYKNGLLNGNISTYRESGKLESIEEYKNDDFISKKKYNKDGILILHFKTNNKDIWERHQFYESGEKRDIAEAIWDDNGDMYLDGLYKVYYKTGQLKESGVYKKDSLNGTSFLYSKKGKIIYEVKYKNHEETVRYLKDKYGNTIVTLYPEDKTITKYTCVVDADCDEFYPPYFDEDENGHVVKYIWTFTKESNFKDGTAYDIMLGQEGEHITLLMKRGVINEKSSVRVFYKWNGKKYSYYENGELESESTYVNDEKDGQEISYDKYGNVTSTVEWNNGVKDNWTIDCSKTPCEYSFTSYFNDQKEAENQGWEFYDNDNRKSFIPNSPEKAKGTYYWEAKKNGLASITGIDLPINFDENFQASVITDWWNGDEKTWYGLIVGWENWDNYVSLSITSSGYYQAEVVKKGINFGMQDYEKFEGRTFSDNTKLNIVKSNEKLIFTINQKIVYISELSELAGKTCGITVSGTKTVLFDNFKVTKYKTKQTSKPKSDYSNKNQWAGNGSGIIISKNGFIVTNNHVIKDASEIEVEFLYNNEIKSFNAKVVKTDPINDLAIIKIDDNAFTGLASIKYNFKTRPSQVGESVFALGYPKALTLMGKEIKFTDGKISSKTGFQGNVTTYQTTTPIQPGNSGGPLFDYEGNFIAINSAKIVQDDVDNVSYSIKSLYLLTLIDSLAESVELPSDTSISSLPLTTKIKKLEKYVTLIKVR